MGTKINNTIGRPSVDKINQLITRKDDRINELTLKNNTLKKENEHLTKALKSHLSKYMSHKIKIFREVKCGGGISKIESEVNKFISLYKVIDMKFNETDDHYSFVVYYK